MKKTIKSFIFLGVVSASLASPVVVNGQLHQDSIYSLDDNIQTRCVTDHNGMCVPPGYIGTGREIMGNTSSRGWSNHTGLRHRPTMTSSQWSETPATWGTNGFRHWTRWRSHPAHDHIIVRLNTQ